MASVVNASTSICGIDIGSENCYVAVARQGGIEILLNEYSQRSTPSYIAFGGNQRELGVSAKQKQMMNLKNTCFAPTLIIGKKYEELNLDEIPYRVEKNKDGDVVIVANHGGEDLHLTPVQVLAMLFTKLRQISGNVIDCVINCPNYFTDTQRRALMNAAHIAGLNPLKIIQDMTAIALYYGFYRNSSAQECSIVGFLDCGHSSIQASVVLFNHKEHSLNVLNTGFVSNIGGKNFDEVLATHFINQKKLNLNNRARYRLLAECEKVKKQMSANSNELPINIECLQDDKDFSARIDRGTFEQLSEGLLDKIKQMLQQTWEGAQDKFMKQFAEQFKMDNFKVDSVEVVGGTSRIPAIKRMVKDIFQVEPSTTLNADEAVARGCALQCAILSPTFKVARELKIVDSLTHEIDFRYSTPVQAEKSVSPLYPKGHQYPFTKQISINPHQLPIAIKYAYINNEGTSVPFAEYSIDKPASYTKDLKFSSENPVKLRVNVNANGIFQAISATTQGEKVDAGEPMDQSNDNASGENMDTDDANAANSNEQNSEKQNSEEPKRKKKSATVDLTITPHFILGDMDKKALQDFTEFEANLILADKNWKEKTDAKNALEEFIYEWRDRLESGNFDVFINDKNKESFRKQLEENENWLYKQDEDDIIHSKSVYEEKTNDMANKYANNVLFLKREFENRPRFLEQLGSRLQQAQKLTLNSDPEEKEDFDKFTKEYNEKAQWFDEAQGKLISAKTFNDPPIKCEEIQQKTSQIDAAINKLQNSRTRRAEQKRKAAEAAAAEAKKQAEQQQKKDEAGDTGAPTTEGMDVDGNEAQNGAQ